MHPITDDPGLLDDPHNVGGDGADAGQHEVEEDGDGLGDIVRGEEEGGDVGEGDKAQGVDEEDPPDVVILEVKS